VSRLYEALMGRSLESPSTRLTGANILKLLGGSMASDAGIYVSPDTAMRFSAVYRSVSLLAGTIASFPLHTYVRPTTGGREKYDSVLLRDPHPDMTPYEFWEFAVTSILLQGDATTWKARDSQGRIAQLWPLHPKDVRIFRDKPTSDNPSGKLFEVTDPPSGSQRTFTRNEILHIPAISMDGVKGLSPIAASRQAIGLGLAAERFGARMFSRGALLQGVLRTDKELKDAAVDRLKQQWRDKTTGPDAHWDIPVLDQGTTYVPIGLPPEDAQYIEVRKFQIDDVARVFGIPPHLLGSVEKSTSWGTGIEQQNIGLVVYTLRQITTRIEQRVTKELLPAGRYARFSMDALLRGDARARAEFYAKLRQYANVGGDEIREWEDLPPRDGADEMWRPKNMEVVGAEPPADDLEEADDE
jgi:HK97 family phage portal protein